MIGEVTKHMTEEARLKDMIAFRLERAKEHEAKGDHQRAANCRYLAGIHQERLDYLLKALLP